MRVDVIARRSRTAALILAACGWMCAAHAARWPAVPGEILVGVDPAATGSGAVLRTVAPALPEPVRTVCAVHGVRALQPIYANSEPEAAVAPHEAVSADVYLARFDESIEVAAVCAALVEAGARFAEPNYIGSLCTAPNDPLYSKALYDLIGMEQAWDIAATAPGQLVAILDSGIDTNHPDLAANLSTNYGEVPGDGIDNDENGFADDVHGYNFSDGSADIEDDVGHGTRVAGLIGAVGNNGAGTAGICWQVQLLPLVVADSDGTVSAGALVQALDYAAARGATVINMSLAMGGASQAVEAACLRAARTSLLVAAAGNNGQGYVPMYPAGFDSVLSVAAVDGSGERSSFSNYNLPGVNEYIDLAAPGEGLYTTIVGGLYDSEHTTGTSFAAPLVSGAAALLRGRHPDQSPVAIRGHLESHARLVGDFVSAGLLDAGAALAAPLVPLVEVTAVEIDDSTGIQASNDEDRALDAGETVRMTVTLENRGADLPAFIGTLVSETAGVTVEASSTEIVALPYGKTISNFGEPFVVTAVADAGIAAASFRLEIPGEQSASFRVAVEHESAVPQDIAGDLTLAPGPTWLVSGITTVATGATLTVAPGATVKLEEDAQLVIQGRLSSEGTAEEPIRWANRTPPPVRLFHSPRSYGVGTEPKGIVAAQLTGDRSLDLATANQMSNDVTVLEGDSTGTFIPAASYPVGASPESVIAVDVTGDGTLDLVVANNIGHSLTLLTGDGNGGFVEQATLPTGNGPVSVAAADLDGDGILDIVTADRGTFNPDPFDPNYGYQDDGNTISILRGLGGGQFEAFQTMLTGSHPSGVVVAQLNDDTIPDLVTCDAGDDAVSVFLGLGGGAFADRATYSVSSGTAGINDAGPEGLIAEDLDGDGVVDLVTANGNGDAFIVGCVSVLKGKGDGTFEAARSFAAERGTLRVIAADVTGDGILDLVATNNGSFSVSVFAGQGGGSFADAVRFELSSVPCGLVAADLDADGTLDLATTDGFTGGMFMPQQASVLLGGDGGAFPARRMHWIGGQPLEVVTFHLPGDHLPDLAVTVLGLDRIAVLANQGDGTFATAAVYPAGGIDPTGIAAADINGDGILDLVAAIQEFDTVAVLAGDATGGFGPPVDFPVMGELPCDVIAVDLNGDDRPDLVTANGGSHFMRKPSNDVSILLFDEGAGGFVFDATYAVGRSPKAVIALDTDNDRHPDLLTADQVSGTVSLLTNDGTGKFIPSAPIFAGMFLEDLLAEDVTGDGVTDLVVVNTLFGTVSVLAGDGTGGFGAPVPHDVGFFPRRVAAGDFNGDGIADLAAANFFDGSVSLLLGTGGGAFLPQVVVPVGANPQGLAARDLNGDGVPDLAVAEYDDETLSVLIGDGAGGFGQAPSVLALPGSDVAIQHSEFLVQGPVVLRGWGTVRQTNACCVGGTGIVAAGDVALQDCSGNDCVIGLVCRSSVVPSGLSALRNRSAGLIVGDALDCKAVSNGAAGILAAGDLDGCHARLNAGVGLDASGEVRNSVSTRNSADGIRAQRIERCSATYNALTGMVAAAEIASCTALQNGDGVAAPVVRNTIVIGSLGAALVEVSEVDGSAILYNETVTTESIRFNGTILSDNGAESATPESVMDMYIAGNLGGGVRGIPVERCTIVANLGPGIDNNTSASDSNVVLNHGAGVVGGTVVSCYVSGNAGGDLIDGATGTLALEPAEAAPPFLASVTPDETFPIGVRPTTFQLRFSKPMDTQRPLLVAFDRTPPYSRFVVSPAPGWIDDRTWQGWYPLGAQVGEGTHTLSVYGAASADGFALPTDTYHRFVVDVADGLSPFNLRLVVEGSDRIALTWDPSTEGDLLGYSILRARAAAGPYDLIDSVDAGTTSFTDTGLAPGTTYYYQVYEFDMGFNNRELTAPAFGTTLDGTETPTPGATPVDTATPEPTPDTTPTPTEAPASPIPTARHPELDVNRDGIIDAEDLMLFIEEWHRPVGR